LKYFENNDWKEAFESVLPQRIIYNYDTPDNNDVSDNDDENGNDNDNDN
ncbi:hypothetical protein Kpol_1053p35, partial [Vanderwaltozyma polyspora DSM 70294]